MDAEFMLAPVLGLLVLMLITISGNLLLWLSIATEKKLRTVPNIMILALSSTDFLVGILILPYNIISYIKTSWLMEPVTCKILGFINMWLLVMSVMSLANISINRYCAICHPVVYKTTYTKRNCVFMIAGCAVLSVSLASLPIIGWCRYEFSEEQHFCFAAWESSKSFTIFMIAACFGGPLTCMTFCYYKIITEVRRSRNRILSNNTTTIDKNSSVDDTVENSDNISTVSYSVHHHHTRTTKSAAKVKKRLKDIQLSLTLFVIVVMFIFCWLPYCIVMLLSTFGNYSVPSAIWTTVLMAGFFNSSCNPITYGVINKDIRNNYKKLLIKAKKFICCHRL